MSHMTRKHITIWLGCIFCETCSKASMTMKLHKEVYHKNSESITNFTSFFNRRNQLIGEKMFPMLRSTSSRRFLHHKKGCSKGTPRTPRTPQGCPKNTKKTPQCCPKDALRLHQGSHKRTPRVCLKDAQRKPKDAQGQAKDTQRTSLKMPQGRPKDTPKKPKGSPKEAQRKPQASPKDAQRMPQGRPKDA